MGLVEIPINYYRTFVIEKNGFIEVIYLVKENGEKVNMNLKNLQALKDKLNVINKEKLSSLIKNDC